MKAADLWAAHSAEWRQPAQVISQWKEAGEIHETLLEAKVVGKFWRKLEELGITLLVGREYEHLMLALSVRKKSPHISYLRLPHPSGVAVDRRRGEVHIAATRNPNQIFTFGKTEESKTLLPMATRFYPGSLYLHDLALIGGKLYGNAVGHNAVVQLTDNGGWKRVWWPHCIEKNGKPRFDKNFIQLNSIAPGATLRSSFFSASTDQMSTRRPGHLNFAVDKRGVIFSGATREPIARGLTRPHSARIHDKRVWVANSGYGELGYAENGKFRSVHSFGSWTRGLCFYKDVAIVGCSRVLPRFRHYAPGLEVSKSRCGIHLFDVTKGTVEGSLIWPNGNQIFAVDWLPSDDCEGFPFSRGGSSARAYDLFSNYSFGTKRRGLI